MAKAVRQEDVAEILNRINDALEGTIYEASGYDNTGEYLCVIIDRKIYNTDPVTSVEMVYDPSILIEYKMEQEQGE